MKQIELPQISISENIDRGGIFLDLDFTSFSVDYCISYKNGIKNYYSKIDFYLYGTLIKTEKFDSYIGTDSKRDAHENTFLLLDNLDLLNEQVFNNELDTSEIINDLRSTLERQFLYMLFIYSYVFEVEGGYVNDPYDTGGETNLGISKRYHPDVDIKNLTYFGAYKIYEKHYLHDAIKIFEDNKIPDVRILLVIFGFVINSGKKNVVWFLDGETQITYDEMIQKRYEYYHNLVIRKPHFERYENGWNNRIAKLETWIEKNAEDYN